MTKMRQHDKMLRQMVKKREIIKIPAFFMSGREVLLFTILLLYYLGISNILGSTLLLITTFFTVDVMENMLPKANSVV